MTPKSTFTSELTDEDDGNASDQGDDADQDIDDMEVATAAKRSQVEDVVATGMETRPMPAKCVPQPPRKNSCINNNLPEVIEEVCVENTALCTQLMQHCRCSNCDPHAFKQSMLEWAEYNACLMQRGSRKGQSPEWWNG
eukprot:366578-Amphidinium_carterae.2